MIAPAEALAADPLPDAVAVMQLAVAASAHRAGGVKVRRELQGLGTSAGSSTGAGCWCVSLQAVAFAGGTLDDSWGAATNTSACNTASAFQGLGRCCPHLPATCVIATPQLPEGAGRLAVFIDGTESDADLAALKVRHSLRRQWFCLLGLGWVRAH